MQLSCMVKVLEYKNTINFDDDSNYLVYLISIIKINLPISQKLLPVEQKSAQFRPHGVERVHVYVQLLELLPVAKFHAQIWQV